MTDLSEPSHAKERGVYQGDVKTMVTPTNETVHLKHGNGTYVFPNKFFKYTGAWVNGKMSGRGLLQMGDGSSYEGPFVDGEMMGIGVRRWANGSTYWGSVFQGHMHGEGRYLGSNRLTYEGSFQLNSRHGRGRLQLPNGETYEGAFQQNHYHGRGRFSRSDGSSYNGDWHQGRQQGHGVERLSNGDEFDGEFVDGKRHGNGIYIQPSGYEYRGRFVDGKRSFVGNQLLCVTELPDAALQRELNEKFEVEPLVSADAAVAAAAASAPAASARVINVTAGEKIPVLHICVVNPPPTVAEADPAAPQRLGLVTHENGRRVQMRIVVPVVPDETDAVPPVWLCTCNSGSEGNAEVEKCQGAENANCMQNSAASNEVVRSTFEGCVSFENLIIRADAPGDLMVTVQFVALPAMPEEQPDSMPPVLELQMLINPGPQSLPNPRKKAPPKKK